MFFLEIKLINRLYDQQCSFTSSVHSSVVTGSVRGSSLLKHFFIRWTFCCPNSLNFDTSPFGVNSKRHCMSMCDEFSDVTSRTTCDRCSSDSMFNACLHSFWMKICDGLCAIGDNCWCQRSHCWQYSNRFSFVVWLNAMKGKIWLRECCVDEWRRSRPHHTAERVSKCPSKWASDTHHHWDWLR